MKRTIKSAKRLFSIIRTWIICMRSGLSFDSSWQIGGVKFWLRRCHGIFPVFAI